MALVITRCFAAAAARAGAPLRGGGRLASSSLAAAAAPASALSTSAAAAQLVAPAGRRRAATGALLFAGGSSRRCRRSTTTTAASATAAAAADEEEEQGEGVVMGRDGARIDLSQFPQARIRNFSIISHIDHGKTTISNRLLTLGGTLSERQSASGSSPMDSLQVERERGITVKAHSASLFYRYRGETYLLNLVDTPGHVDFTYEVTRALRACNGALLIVDASQGVQAQTVANFYLAFDQNLTLVPVLNKIDLPTAEVPRCLDEMQTSFGFRADEVLRVSAKTGRNVRSLLPAIIEQMPPPGGDAAAPLKVLLFDSRFDRHRGVVCLVLVVDGVLRRGQRVVAASTGRTYEAADVGILYPEQTVTDALYTGQVGYVIAGMKARAEARVGDTLYAEERPVEPLPGFRAAKPMVYAGIFSVDDPQYGGGGGDSSEALQMAMEKLAMNDSSVQMQREMSPALGPGYRCGFLGLLHMSVFMQRLEQEFGVSVIATAPTVPYHVTLTSGEHLLVDNPAKFPTDAATVRSTEEPFVEATLVLPAEYLGVVMKLCLERRGTQKELQHLGESRLLVRYDMPLAEVIADFFDRLKQLTSGFASFDYEETGYVKSDLVKVAILLNGEQVDPLSLITHRSKAVDHGRAVVARLKEVVPQQLFQVAIQAAIGTKVVARDNISALRKNVTAKCYGGDITRKRKLLERQKEGKARMKRIGNVDLDQEAFMAVLRKDG